jgi:hypothetical protein
LKLCGIYKEMSTQRPGLPEASPLDFRLFGEGVITLGLAPYDCLIPMLYINVDDGEVTVEIGNVCCLTMRSRLNHRRCIETPNCIKDC